MGVVSSISWSGSAENLHTLVQRKKQTTDKKLTFLFSSLCPLFVSSSLSPVTIKHGNSELEQWLTNRTANN